MLKLTDDDFYRLLLSLRPSGPAWPVDDVEMRAEAVEFARLHARCNDLREEADPRTAFEMLAAWERVAGLPDDCTCTDCDDLTIDERRLRLVQKLTGRGGSSRAYFIALAEALGYPGATIETFPPFHCESECTDALNPSPWEFAWMLVVPNQTRITEMHCESECTDPLRSWGESILECVINGVAPGHTIPIFSYLGA